MDLDEAVTELYGADLTDFVTTRTRVAKAADDPAVAREITTLRKPTLAAWLLNLLVREDDGLLDEVGDLGERMRTAQATGDAATLRSARPERDALVREVVRSARSIAEDRGRSLSASAADEITATVIAALADARSHEALTSGMLVKTLSYSGFGEVEVDEALAARARLQLVRGSGGDETDDADEAPDHEDLRRELVEAELRAGTAATEVVAAEERVAEAEVGVSEARAALDTAEAELAQAQAHLADRGAAQAAADKMYRAVRRVLPR